MKHILLLIIVSVTLVACRSTQRIEKGGAVATPPEAVAPITKPEKGERQAVDAAFVARAANVKLQQNCVTASVKVGLAGIGKDLSVNGSLRMKRNDVVRLSLRFLGMEVGLMEFTPSEVLVVDRINKQYVRAAYSEISFLRQANLDFHSLQALFWDELFVPGQVDLSKAEKQFSVANAGGQKELRVINAPQLDYAFRLSANTAVVEQLLVRGKKATDKGEFRWSYGSFAPFGGRSFPTTMQMQVSGTSKNVALSLKLSSLNNDCNWEPRTKLSAKYAQRSVDEVLKGLNL